jgi:hypothetical protein
MKHSYTRNIAARQREVKMLAKRLRAAERQLATALEQGENPAKIISLKAIVEDTSRALLNARYDLRVLGNG